MAEDVTINGNNINVIIVGKEETTKLLRTNEIDNYLKSQIIKWIYYNSAYNIVILLNFNHK